METVPALFPGMSKSPRSALTFSWQAVYMARQMKLKIRYIVRPDEVIVTRQGESAVIDYKEKGFPTTHFGIGPEINDLTDEEIVELFNESLRNGAKLAADYKHVAVEVPLGSPQIEYFKAGKQWTPRGGVLRCLIDDDENMQAVIQIDDKELQIEEFGRLLRTYAGWGMRIEFVPEEEIHRRPTLDVREPKSE
jgi:hypothetical protein